MGMKKTAEIWLKKFFTVLLVIELTAIIGFVLAILVYVFVRNAKNGTSTQPLFIFALIAGGLSVISAIFAFFANKKGKSSLLFVSLLIFVMSFVPTLPYMPITSNMVAAYRINTYVSKIYPDYSHKFHIWAHWVPLEEHDKYSALIMDNSGEKHAIYCDNMGYIYDSKKKDEYNQKLHDTNKILLKENSMLKDKETEHNAYTYVYELIHFNYRWSIEEADTPEITMKINLKNSMLINAPANTKKAVANQFASILLYYYEGFQSLCPELAEHIVAIEGYYDSRYSVKLKFNDDVSTENIRQQIMNIETSDIKGEEYNY